MRAARPVLALVPLLLLAPPAGAAPDCGPALCVEATAEVLRSDCVIRPDDRTDCGVMLRVRGLAASATPGALVAEWGWESPSSRDACAYAAEGCEAEGLMSASVTLAPGACRTVTAVVRVTATAGVETRTHEHAWPFTYCA